MASSPTLPSPPHKKQRVDIEPILKEEAVLSEVPVKAMFVPPSTAASTSKPIHPKKKGRKHKRPLPEPFSPADVMFHDVRDFLGATYIEQVLSRKDSSEWEPPTELGQWEIVETVAGAFTVSGESISLWQPEGSDKKWAIITPFAHPGDRIRCRIHKHDRFCSYADLVEILEYSEEFRGGEGDRRKNPEGGCRYFGECGGCQLQPLPYALQLAHKLKTVSLAYERFSNLPSTSVPTIQPTIGSPKQWGYRTKITPHFDAPQKWARAAKAANTADSTAIIAEEDVLNSTQSVNGDSHTEGEKRNWECRIGFERKGRPGVMDIEECPIATPVLNSKMTEERQRIKESIMTFKKGATLLLRDSLKPPSPLPSASNPFNPTTPIDLEDHIAITNSREAVYERVGSFLFSFAAGSFFQNNNSILVPLTEYVREAIFPAKANGTKPTHLVDTYCGSGLFGITLSPFFEKVAGVEISHDSIVAAKRNAEINGITEVKASWLCGKAEELFAGLPGEGFEGGKSCVVVDPPRKGCDEPFLEQLLAFKPLTVVYVSCNVHTQARDVGWLINESAKRAERVSADESAEGNATSVPVLGKYVLESLRGFDLFPQTAHVESVAVLRLVE